MLMETQKRIYRAHRAMAPYMGLKASYALKLAREGVERKTVAETSGYAGKNGDTPIRYWESKAQVPFRFTGYADEVAARIGHKGWYCDQFQDRTLRGIVFQLPARNGVTQYVPGYEESDGWSVVLYLDRLEEESRDAAYAADSLAERMAEQEREYNESWQAGSVAAEAIRDALGALRDLMRARVGAMLYPDRAGLLSEDSEPAWSDYLETRDALRDAIRKASREEPTSGPLRDAYRDGLNGTATIPAISRRVGI